MSVKPSDEIRMQLLTAHVPEGKVEEAMKKIFDKVCCNRLIRCDGCRWDRAGGTIDRFQPKVSSTNLAVRIATVAAKYTKGKVR